MPQFDPAVFLPQIFWLFITFGVVVLAMYFLVVPRIHTGISMRDQYLNDLKDKTNDCLDQTQKLTAQIHSLKSENEENAKVALANLRNQLMHDKELKLSGLQEALARERHHTLISYQNEIHDMQDDIPMLAKEMADMLTKNLLNSKTIVTSGPDHGR